MIIIMPDFDVVGFVDDFSDDESSMGDPKADQDTFH